MNKQKFTYKLSGIIAALAIWEILFWAVFVFFLTTAGFFGLFGTGEKLMFKHAGYLYALALIPVMIALYIRQLIRRNKSVQSAGKAYHSLIQPVSDTTSFLRYFLLRNALAFLILALAGPVFGSKKVKAVKETLELVVCLDISNSMNTKDITKQDSRLDISKRALVQLINNLNGEQIGLVLFANDAFVQLPITSDYAAAKLFIDDVETSMISNQGTDIGAALSVALDMFSEKKVSKGILLITDGEDHEGNIDEPIKALRKKEVTLSLLAIGTESGGLVPKDPDRPEIGYKTDASGRSVLSKVNRDMVQSIAGKANGHAEFSDSEFPDLSPLLTQLSSMKREKIDILDFEVKQERYQYPLVLSLLFLIVYILWTVKFTNLFNRKK